MKVKATVLCENSVFSQRGAIAEHGWAVLLETADSSFLLDTGQGQAIINNAQVLKKDLSAIRAIILSHRHFDHTGGLLKVLNERGKVDVYAHPDLFKEAFSTRGGKITEIGVPFNRSALEYKGANFIFNKDFREIAPDLFITGEIPRRTEYEHGDKDQVIREGAGYVKDPIFDDQSVVIKTGQGLFIVLGCAHAGIINTIEHAIKMTGEERIHTIMGGTHLGPVEEEQRAKSLKDLRKYNIQHLAVSHCTGLPTAVKLAQEYGERFMFCNVGTVVEGE